MTVLETDYVSYLTYLICNEAFPMVLPVIASTNSTLVRSNLPSGLESKFQEVGVSVHSYRDVRQGGSCSYQLEEMMEVLESAS